MTVEPRTLLAPFEYTGQTAGSREIEVRARVNGILQARNFTEGGRVARGQSLYTIDPAPFAAAVARAEADLAAAEARLDQARRNAARLKPLQAEKAVSQKDVEAGRLVLPADRNFEVSLRTADGTVYAKTGRLSFTDIRVSGQTGTSEARAELANP